ncbi:MAG: hypothetical protein EXS35_18440 [Pedosphaera sp.]|nr:hypothetical protein [Pedosphaera sp.]
MTPLPNYFLADLPPDAAISPVVLREACLTLKRNRAQYLAHRSTEQIVRLLCDVGDGWLQPENPFRKLALAEGPAQTGFGRATLERGLDQFFRQFTPENFRALLVQELGDARRLDEFCATPGETRAAIATGPELLVHIAAGNVPNPTLMSLALGLLTRSAQFAKSATGAAFLPRLFAHSIYDFDRKLGSCLEIAEWRGGNPALEEILFAEADCVTATGGDETLAAIRAKLPARTRFVGYGHQVSFGFLAGGVLHGSRGRKLVAAAADDVVAWNQLGCLSPHVFYVQRGGEIAPEHFAQMLAEELERRETTEPRGEVSAAIAAGIASRRGIYEVRAAHSAETRLWRSKDSTAWTVVFEADATFAMSCLHRFVYVKAVRDLAEALRGADAVSGKVSTVGLAADEKEIRTLAEQLARWGVTRVCAPGQMQNPPLTWRHDGRPALGDFVTWADWEK